MAPACARRDQRPRLPQVPASFAALYKGAIAATGCLRIISRVPQIDALSADGATPERVDGHIELRDVRFAYPAAPAFDVLRATSLVVPAGTSCALCGPSGSGKSTVVALLERFYDPLGGSVLLDGADLRSLNLPWLRRQMGLVAQEPVLFEGTVADNIRYGKEGAALQEVEAAARLANAHDFITRDLSDGYDTQVGALGGKLSGGQKQRVAIARALIKRPSVLLLDEATSALDNKSEKVVQAALDQLTRGAHRFTSIIIAHRLTTIRHADKIAVTRQGAIVEEGTCAPEGPERARPCATPYPSPRLPETLSSFGRYDELLAMGGLFHSLGQKAEQDEADDSGVVAEVMEERIQRRSEEASSASGERSPLSPRSPALPSRQGSEEVPPLGGEEAAAGGAKKAKKAKKAKAPSPSSRLLAMFSPSDRRLLACGCAGAAIAGTAIGFMGIVMVKATYVFRDTYDPDALRSKVLLWGGISLGLGVTIHVVDTLFKICFGITGEHLTRQLRVLALRQLLRQEIGYFDEDANSVGALTEFLAEKVSLVQGLAQGGFQQLITLLTSLVTAITISCVFGDWRLLLFYTGGFILSMVFLVTGQNKAGAIPETYKPRGHKEVDVDTEESRSAGAIVGEVVGAIRTVASFNAEVRFLDRYRAEVQRQRAAGIGGAPLASLLMGIGQAGGMIVAGAVIWFGFHLMEEDPSKFFGSPPEGCMFPTVDIGRMIIPMMSMIGISSESRTRNLLIPRAQPAEQAIMSSHLAAGFLMGLAQNAAVVTDAKAAKDAAAALFERIDRLSLRDPSSESGERPADVHGEVDIREVSFSYPTRPAFRILRGYSLHVAAGSVCALVGASGSGKSTIIALLQRFYDPSRGAIFLDGRDITTLNLSWLRRQIGLVAQEPVLFQGTVADNIAYGKEGATREEIEEAAKLANAHEFITGMLSAQYATQVGLRGSQLSGGQKQRVAIARAVVRRPTLMLLDEATSALDNESEKLVQAALDQLTTTQRRTTITIAHRLSTIRGADKIACVNRGAVVEQGTHDELLAIGGFYFDLSQAQM